MSRQLTALRRYQPREEAAKVRNGRVQAIRDALAVGHTQTEIADALGISRQRVSEIIRQHKPKG